jgi:hypothetical protein
MPLKFWDEAFLTATFLINLLPTKVLNLVSPVEKLLEVSPHYESLRTFGCACWPNLRPYNKHKLAFRSKRCVFLGYSPMHKGVKCLDTSTGRVYISRDVVFDEQVFPFASLNPNAGKRLKDDILLLSDSLASTHKQHEGEHIDDFMSMPIVPVTNILQHTEDHAPDRSSTTASHTAQNSASNGGSTHEISSSESDAENDENLAETEEDLLQSPGQSLPGSPVSGAVSPSASATCPGSAGSSDRAADSAASSRARGSASPAQAAQAARDL